MIHPRTPPDRLLSETGRRIVDLLQLDVSLRQIARHVGCRHSQLQLLRDDPSATASRALIVELETLHENVLSGKNKWSRMVDALVAHGWTYEHIAVRVGVSEKYLRGELSDPLRIPTNDMGEKLEGLYKRHVRDLLRY